MSTAPPSTGRWASDALALRLDEAGTQESITQGDSIIVGHTRRIAMLIEGWAYREGSVDDDSRNASAFFLPGDILNLDGVFLQSPRGSYRALTDSRVISCAAEDLNALMQNDPALARAMLHAAVRENTMLTERAVVISRSSAVARVAHFLCELTLRMGFAIDGGAISFACPMTREQIGAILGLTSVHLAAVLNELGRDGVIHYRPGEIQIYDLAMLADKGGFDPTYLALDPLDMPHADEEAEKARLERVEMLLQETNHRCANDLQMVVGLLRLQARQTGSDDAQRVLEDAAQRIGIIARARSNLVHGADWTLDGALREVCEALHAQAEPRAILVSLAVEGVPPALPDDKVTAIALVVNELATNAVKHAFKERTPGSIHVRLSCDNDNVRVTVDDDGLPFEPRDGSGLGLPLVNRLVRSAGGRLSAPQGDSKIFVIELDGASV